MIEGHKRPHEQSRMGRCNIIKMSVLLKSSYNFSAIPIKDPVDFFFMELDILILKFI